jgi:energy-coupling factor transporter ATP-binding protein EcfA2
VNAGKALQGYLPRHDDLNYISDCVRAGECCALVGPSNVGKSTLLRSLARAESPRRCSPQSGQPQAMTIYLDCNLMAEMTEQGFCELILRGLLAEARRQAPQSELADALRSLHGQTVNPSSSLMVPLSLNQALTLLAEDSGRQVVLLMDEFDAPFVQLHSRVFLNLRALRDKHREQLVYVVATDHPLRGLRHDPEVDEFCELFAHRTRTLCLLPREETRWLLRQFAEEEGVVPSSEDGDFIWQQAGGHPGLLRAAFRVMAQAMRPDDPFWRLQEYRAVRGQLEDDPVVRVECAKLWDPLSAEEQRALILLERGRAAKIPRSLVTQGIICEGAIFAELFEGFVRRQGLVHRPRREGVRVDVESGHVWVDGRLIPPLSELEYRLLLLLYGRLGDICTKDQIAEAVWGTEYMEAVDDARIDKLVSRLRQKVETETADPRHVVTIRGRGYQLVRP